jgi:hypothetical protein
LHADVRTIDQKPTPALDIADHSTTFGLDRAFSLDEKKPAKLAG